jgi:uncharacterized membrane protein
VKNSTRLLAIVSAVCFLWSCGDKADPVTEFDTLDSEEDGGGAPAWADVEPVFSANCTKCHSSTKQGADRNGAPVGVNFDSYEGAAGKAALIDGNVQAGVMPPAGPLPDDEKALIHAWVEGGSLQ